MDLNSLDETLDLMPSNVSCFIHIKFIPDIFEALITRIMCIKDLLLKFLCNRIIFMESFEQCVKVFPQTILIKLHANIGILAFLIFDFGEYLFH